MAKVTYKVLPGKVITGQHKVYVAGESYPDTEACGDMAQAVKDGTVEIVRPVMPATTPAAETEDGLDLGAETGDEGKDQEPPTMGAGAQKRGGGRPPGKKGGGQ
ncbi:MAG: hypothetical protein IMZ69_08400 [Spirochaetes bacterium]|nr:hypothetical protein [Spirochaetota bacterium]